MKKIFMPVLMGIFLMMNFYGCAAVVVGAAGGAGTAAWLSGKLAQEVRSSYEDTVHGTKAALKAMDYPIIKEVNASDVTQIRAIYSDGRKIWIDIRYISKDSSQIEIRVGAVGDKVASDELLKKIIAYL